MENNSSLYFNSDFNPWAFLIPSLGGEPISKDSSLEQKETASNEATGNSFLNFEPTLQGTFTEHHHPNSNNITLSNAPPFIVNPPSANLHQRIQTSQIANFTPNQRPILNFATELGEKPKPLVLSPSPEKKIRKRREDVLTSKPETTNKIAKISKENLTTEKKKEKSEASKISRKQKKEYLEKLEKEREQRLNFVQQLEPHIKKYCAAFPQTGVKPLLNRASFPKKAEISVTNLSTPIQNGLPHEVNEQNDTISYERIQRIVETIIAEAIKNKAELADKIPQSDEHIKTLQVENQELKSCLMSLVMFSPLPF